LFFAGNFYKKFSTEMEIHFVSPDGYLALPASFFSRFSLARLQRTKSML
jgi:hypothetical protein